MVKSEKNHQLVACYVCGGNVSKRAVTCPHCGQSKPVKIEKTSLKTRLIVYSLLTIFLMVGILSNQNNGGPSRAPASPVLNPARETCLDAIRGSVKNPSTLDIHTVTGYGTDTLGDGTIRITQTFSAKNTFGLQQTYDAYCTMSPNGKFNIKITEQSG